MEKCKMPNGIVIRPNGVDELDPCIYETIEVHKNVNVEVRRCRRCGHIDIAWYRTDETEDEIMSEETYEKR